MNTNDETTSNPEVSEPLARFLAAIRKSSNEWANRWDRAMEKLETHPTCAAHPETEVTIDRDASIRETAGTLDSNGKWTLRMVVQCPQCALDRSAMTTKERLKRWGIGDSHAHCSFANWDSRTDNDREALAVAKRFATSGKPGALIILSPGVGNGKTHIGTAVLRRLMEAGTTRGAYITHPVFLRNLRASYSTKGPNPIDALLAKQVVFFDEFGLSAGGADEEPAIYDTFDGLYRSKAKLIVAGNFKTADAFKAALSLRIYDRLREMIHNSLIVMTGPSRRGEQTTREQYQQPYKD